MNASSRKSPGKAVPQSMILPIGHEESAVRRQPWIVYGTLLVCFLVYLAVPAPEYTGTDGDREVALEDAVLYWLDRPYLELDPALVEAVRGLLIGLTDADRARLAERVDGEGWTWRFDEVPPDSLARLEAYSARLAELALD